MAETDVAELERQVRAGEWLGPVDIARLLRVDRKTVHNWMTATPPIIRSRRRGLRNREGHPGDVLRQLEDQRKVTGGEDQSPSA